MNEKTDQKRTKSRWAGGGRGRLPGKLTFKLSGRTMTNKIQEGLEGSFQTEPLTYAKGYWHVQVPEKVQGSWNKQRKERPAGKGFRARSCRVL